MSAKRLAKQSAQHSPVNSAYEQSRQITPRAETPRSAALTPRSVTKQTAPGYTPSPIRVTISGAKGLAAIGKYFCVCNVPGKKRLRFKTQSQWADQSLSRVVWDHHHDFAEFDASDALQISVQREDPAGDDLIGRVTLPPEKFFGNGFDGKLVLENAGESTNVSVTVKIEVDPDSSSTRMPSPVGRASPPGGSMPWPIKVTILKARGVHGVDANSAFSSYCACNVPGKKRMRFKTAAIADDSAPVWNHSHEFAEFTTTDSLQFSVFLQDPKGDDLLGRITIDTAQLVPNGFDGKLGLENAGQPVKISVTVKVEVLKGGASLVAMPSVLGTLSKPAEQQTPSRPQADNVQTFNLKLVVHGAKGVGAELTTYCVCNVPGKKRLRFKTQKAIGDKPVWEHAEEFQDVASTDSLKFSIFAQEKSGDELLGSAVLEPKDYAAKGYEGRLALENAGQSLKTSVSVKVDIGSEQQGTPNPMLKGRNDSKVRHDTPTHHHIEPAAIQVTVMGARDLEHPEGSGYLNCFCSCQVPGKKAFHFKTPEVSDKANPVWRFKHTFEEFLPSDSLKFGVFHHIPQHDELLGTAELKANQFLKNGFDGRVPLENPQRATWASLSVRIDILRPRSIRITIMKAMGIRKPADSDGLGTFCICKVPGKKGGKFRTAPIQLIDPEWKHSHDFKDIESHDLLEFKVFEESHEGDNLLGRATLETDQFFTQGFEGPLPLEGDATLVFNATILVKVELIKDSDVRVPNVLNGSEEEKLRTIFRRCDISGKGLLNKKELQRACNETPEVAPFFSLPVQLRNEDGSSSLIEAIFTRLDVQGDREASWEEFKKFYRATKELVRVTLKVTMKTLSYADMKANSSVLGSLQLNIKNTIAVKAKVPARCIEVEMLENQHVVNFRVVVTPPDNIKAGDIATSLNGPPPLSAGIQDDVCQVPGIGALSIGAVGLNEVGFARLEVASDSQILARKETTSEQHANKIIPGEFGTQAVSTPPDMTAGGLFELSVPEHVKALGLRPNAPPPGRVLIAKVEEGSWAADAGIVEGTEIVAIDQLDVQLLTTETFVRSMQKRPLTLSLLVPSSSVTKKSGSPKFPVQARMTDELDYALGWDPSAERTKRPNAMHGAADPDASEFDQYYPDINEQRDRLKELSRVCDRARIDTLELRQRKAHHSAEVARLEQLVALGDDPTYCRNCDLRMLNLQILLRALGRVSLAVFSDFAYRTGDYEILAESAEALTSAAYLDTHIAELAAYVSDSLSQIPTEPGQKPRTLGDVLPAARHDSSM